MDKKDEIILQQLDVIREMTERNLRRVGADIWGVPNKTSTEKTVSADRRSSEVKGADPNKDASRGAVENEKPKTAASTGQGDPKAPKEDELPPENIDDLKKELDSYIGLGVIKDEVRDLINMVTVWKMRKEHDLPAPDLSLHMVFSGNP